MEDAQPVHLAGVGEAQQRVVAVGDQQVFDEVLVAQAGGGAPGAAPPLRLVDAERLPLGVAAVGDGDDGIFLGDEVFVREVELRAQNLGAPLVAVALADVLEFFPHHLLLPFVRGENRQQFGDFLQDAVVLLDEAILLQRGEAVQAQFEDALRLFFGEVVEAVVAAPQLRC